MSIYHDHDCDNCHVYKACGWFGDILVKPRCFVDDKCDPDIYVPDLKPLRAVAEDKSKVLVAVDARADHVDVYRCDEGLVARYPNADIFIQRIEMSDSTLDLEVEEKGGGDGSR